MKMLSQLRHLKSIKKYLKGTRLIIVLAIAGVLLVGGVSVAAYTINQQKEKQQAADVQPKPATPKSTVEPKPSTKAEEKPVASDNGQPAASNSAQPAPVSTSKPAVEQTTKPKPHTSEDPAFVACVQKYSDLYVQYNADIESMNEEKSLAFATLDELYNSGFYSEMDPIEGAPYNQWQADRAELESYYSGEFANLYSTYVAESAPYLGC